MSENIILNAKVRHDIGKGASRRLRRSADLVPAVIYGAGKDTVIISIPQKEITHALKDRSVYNSLLFLNVDGKKETVVMKDMQRHPFKALVLHIDFMRIDAKKEMEILIPLHFIGEDIAPGVKIGGGKPIHYMKEIEIKCFPSSLPNAIEVDLSNLELNKSIYLSDIKLPKDVNLTVDLSDEDNDLPVASIQLERAQEEEIENAAPEAAETEITSAKAEDKAENNKGQ